MSNAEAYAAGLGATKANYPFESWAESGEDLYPPEMVARFTHLFDVLIQKLATAGPIASEAAKLALFQEAVDGLNQINREDEGLIETSERDHLCELCDVIAVASGLNPRDYGDGEGVASEWREW